MNAFIFIKSPVKETYNAIFSSLLKHHPQIKKIHWVFYQIKLDSELVDNIGKDIGREFHVINDPKDLQKISKNINVFDVSSLPKEDLTEVLATLLKRNNIQIYTLTRNLEENYIDLMSGAAMKSFAKTHQSNVLVVKISSIVIVLGLLSAAIIKVVELVPQSPQLITWFGLLLSLSGLVLTVKGYFKG